MTKEVPVHKDRLGREIKIDDFVAYPSHNSLQFGKVVKLNNKMVGVIPAVSKRGAISNSGKAIAKIPQPLPKKVNQAHKVSGSN